MGHGRFVLTAAIVAAFGGASARAAGGADDYAAQVEADWLVQITTGRQQARGGRQAPPPVTVDTKQDARGGCDGVIDGRWGFHTGAEAKPWWQVDLGAVHELARVVVYNRCDGEVADRAATLTLLLSADGKSWREVYRHDGSVFHGFADKKPLAIDLARPLLDRLDAGNPSLPRQDARFVRIQLQVAGYLHLDEVEVYGLKDPKKNLARGRPADQSSASQWSTPDVPARPAAPVPPPVVGPDEFPTAAALLRGRRLAEDLRRMGVDVSAGAGGLDEAERKLAEQPSGADAAARKAVYFAARAAVRELVLSNPLLDFDKLLFAERVPGTFCHMSDQYYGWWSRPGGGICILEGFKAGRPRVRCITEGKLPPGNFLRPDLSYDGTKAVFAYCRYYSHVAGLPDKVNKANLPADAFYSVYEINVDGTGLRRLTGGKYDDFDARYLPNGDIVFLSTRRAQFIQCGRASAQATLEADLPNSYVRCGGDNRRPVPIYTLHVMDRDGGNLRAISPFENFEWTPSVAADGRILYARWDYVDRHNMPFMSLWSTNPDGTNPQAVYGNFTRVPHCIFEARSIPGSNKIVFTGSAHHAQTGGGLVLLDPDVGQDGPAPITRLTPEVCFPEAQGWPTTYYANPWPLSETYYLVAWSPLPIQRGDGGGSWGTIPPAARSLGLYYYDAFGNRELIYRDGGISCMYPIPLRPRPRPPILASAVRGDEKAREGRFFLADVYDGLPGVGRGSIKRLRVVNVPAKTQPHMNSPHLGATRDDPGKCVLGTVPVEPDGSAYFRVPAGTIVFFQALDAAGRTVQTMRTVTYVQPDTTLSCAGCHEPRTTAPGGRQALALRRAPSKLKLAPEGSWPLRFDRLVQPVLDKHCVRCHRAGPDGKAEAAAKAVLTPDRAYRSLASYGGAASIHAHVRQRYGAGRSIPGKGASSVNGLVGMFLADKPHHDVRLDRDGLERLLTWIDTYGQVLGSFSADQEAGLLRLREACSAMLEP